MLARTIGTHPLEDYSHEMANYLNKVISISVTSFLVLEMIFYNIYATKVLLARWLTLGAGILRDLLFALGSSMDFHCSDRKPSKDRLVEQRKITLLFVLLLHVTVR